MLGVLSLFKILRNLIEFKIKPFKMLCEHMFSHKNSFSEKNVSILIKYPMGVLCKLSKT